MPGQGRGEGELQGRAGSSPCEARSRQGRITSRSTCVHAAPARCRPGAHAPIDEIDSPNAKRGRSCSLFYQYLLVGWLLDVLVTCWILRAIFKQINARGWAYLHDVHSTSDLLYNLAQLCVETFKVPTHVET